MQNKSQTMNSSYKWSCKFLLALFLLTGYFEIGSMLPTGAPKAACSEMDPSLSKKHAGGKQEGIAPFQLTINKAVVAGGGTVTLQLDERDGPFDDDDFRGFMVQGLKNGSNKALGKFTVETNDPTVKQMTCNEVQGSSVTHVSREEKSSVMLTWMAPKLEHDTDVQFFFTVVVGLKKFWVKQEANQIVRVKASGKDCI